MIFRTARKKTIEIKNLLIDIGDAVNFDFGTVNNAEIWDCSLDLHLSI